MAPPELRPLSFGELLDRSFSYYRKHFWVFVGIMAVPQVFAVILNLTIEAMAQMESQGAAQAALFLVFLAALLTFLLSYAVAFGAITFAVAEVHLGRTTTIREAYRQMRGRTGRVLNLAFSVIVRMLGCALTLVLLPLAVLMMYWYALSVPALLLENVRAREALKRSRFLTRGQLDRIFVIGILMGVVTWTVMLILQGPFLGAAALLAAKDAPPPYWLNLLTNLSGSLAGALTGPLMMIALVLLYYDVRVRKEGYDLQLMMETLPAAAPAPAPPAEAAPELRPMSVPLVILLTFITGGIYYPIWFLTRRRAFNNLRSSEKLGVGAFVFLIAGFVAIILLAIAREQTKGSDTGEALKILDPLTQLVVGIVGLVQCFRVRSILTDHFSAQSAQPSEPFSATVALQSEVSISGVATFFLNIWYLQYKINRLLEKFGPPSGQSSLPASA